MKLNELERSILEAAANDFEQLEAILSQLSDWSRSPFEDADVAKVEAVLRDLIVSDDIGAYKLSTVSPYRTAVTDVGEDLSGLWFYITEQGKKRLRETEAEQVDPSTRTC